MKKRILALILTASFLYIWIYPCIYTDHVQANNIIKAETSINHREVAAIGALGIGEVVTAFTLAEVLITLTIIGVIAALTIPSLITNIQDAQYHTAWKKVYSDLDAATKRMIMDNGGTFLNVCYRVDMYQRNDCLKNTYANYLSYINQCNSHNGVDNCFSQTMADTDSALVLSNGSVISFRYYSWNCSGDLYGPWCSRIMVDVNGLKGPNIVGKDIFGAYLLQDGITPMGSSRLSSSMGRITCSDSHLDLTCSALYLYQ